MKAFIFAAGLGTRLKPYTDTKPKALVEINGKPLLDRTIEHLLQHHFTEIIINVHHFGEQIIEFVKKYAGSEIKIQISDERQELLDTGGGLWFAKHLFEPNEDFLLYNADIVSDLNLNALMSEHKKNKALATLAIRKRETSRYFVFDNEMNLKGWTNIKTQEIKGNVDITQDQLYAFSGIHAVNADIFNHYHQNGKFSITPVYLNLAQNHVIKGHLNNNGYWFDCGKPENLENAATFLSSI